MGCRASRTGWSEDGDMNRDRRDEWRRLRHEQRRLRRAGRRASYGWEDPEEALAEDAVKPSDLTPEQRALREARAEANRKIGFISHLVPYLAVITFLSFVAGPRAALIVALAWGIGLAMPLLRRDRRARACASATCAARSQRAVRATSPRERHELESVHARSLEELSAVVAHEIRNPITAAKSLVQQMGEEPGAPENVEYARVALEELARVERSISHLLRFARDEELRMRLGAAGRRRRLGARDLPRARGAKRRAHRARRSTAEGEIRGDAEKLRRVVINLVATRSTRSTAASAAAAASRSGRREPGRHRGVAARRRRRARARRRNALPRLEPVLHLEGERHRPGPADLQEAGRGARRRDRGDLRAGAAAPTSSLCSPSAARKEASREGRASWSSRTSARSSSRCPGCWAARATTCRSPARATKRSRSSRSAPTTSC